MPAIVFLAAGAGARMGEPKILMRVHGEAWLSLQLRALSAVIDAVAIVVASEDVAARVRALAPTALVTVNPDPSRGPFSSLLCGLSAIGARACFVSPIDVPVAAPSTFAALLATGAPAAVPTYAGRGGHPVWLAEAFVRTAMAKDPARDRLDHVLHATAGVARVDVDDARITTNLNTPEDVAKFVG
ncbi:MAG: NTP transferase domain-containing protein [Deltaproteobacteria bacterium]|nr:NTP transferase domain-containing protein [Deltaproteobacteria bacterium]